MQQPMQLSLLIVGGAVVSWTTAELMAHIVERMTTRRRGYEHHMRAMAAKLLPQLKVRNSSEYCGNGFTRNFSRELACL